MPTISARIIRKPRKARRCDCCRTPLVGPQMRLYGYAEVGDKPHVIYSCDDCLGDDKDTREALARSRRREPKEGS